MHGLMLAPKLYCSDSLYFYLYQRGRAQVGGIRRKKLDPALQGLMGEAHLRFARGDTENGKKMCLEIIR